MRRATAISLDDHERLTLARWARGRSTPARLVLRARIVLAAADGASNAGIARDLAVCEDTGGHRPQMALPLRPGTVGWAG